MKMNKIKKIDYCARCGEDHREIVFTKFKGNPISCDGDDFTYWGWCPNLLEPIILRVDEDEEITDNRTGKDATKEGENHTLCRCPSECQDPKSCTDEAQSVLTD